MTKFNMAEIDIQNIGYHLILYAPKNKKRPFTTDYSEVIHKITSIYDIQCFKAILNFKLVCFTCALAHCYETCYLYVIFE